MFRPLLISMFLTSTAFATTWSVDADGAADFDNIQAAVDAASDGDEIIVMREVAATIIDGENTRQGVTCSTSETNKTVIDGFTITRGFAETDIDGTGGGLGGGGGLYCYLSNPTVSNCVFSNNVALGELNISYGYGGGVYCENSSPDISNCIFYYNSAVGEIGYGGGIRISGGNPSITNCSFAYNTADYGGGIS